jgi:hypothetical protein
MKKIDYENPNNNMYGISPCPQCSSVHRWPSQIIHKVHPGSIICDDCNFIEPIVDLPKYLSIVPGVQKKIIGKKK